MAIRFIIQARTSSTRLPKKVLTKIGNKTLVQHIIERLSSLKAKYSFDFIFAIPVGDNELIEHLGSFNINYSEGDEYNVLSRFLAASRDLKDSDFIFRLTCDNPFVDLKSIAQLIEYSQERRFDYSYGLDLPLGMGTELIRLGALREQKNHKLEGRHKEHVTLFIKENPKLFRIEPIQLKHIENVCGSIDKQKIRLTIDEILDLRLARQVYYYFQEWEINHFNADDVYELARRLPDFLNKNQYIQQKTGTDVQRRKIFIVTQSTASLGSGHASRMQSLAELLLKKFQIQANFLTPDEAIEYEFENALVVIDARDLVISNINSSNKVILIDNRSKVKAPHYTYYDTLPHFAMSTAEYEKSLQSILLREEIASLQSRVQVSNLKLKKSNQRKYRRPHKTQRPLIRRRYRTQFRLRLTFRKLNYQQSNFHSRLNATKVVETYYGQTLFEAIYLGKKIELYSISPYHSQLNRYLFANWHSPAYISSHFDGAGLLRLAELIRTQSSFHS